MDIRPRLLKRLMYQAWTRAKVPVEQLASYHRSYVGFIGRIPFYWRAVIDESSPAAAGDSVIQDELDHNELWKFWGSALPPAINLSGLGKTITAFDAIQPSRLPGALHAFNVQQLEVDQTKKARLLSHYHDPELLLTILHGHCHEVKRNATASDSGNDTRIRLWRSIPASIEGLKNRAMRRSLFPDSTMIGSWRCGTAASPCRWILRTKTGCIEAASGRRVGW